MNPRLENALPADRVRRAALAFGCAVLAAATCGATLAIGAVPASPGTPAGRQPQGDPVAFLRRVVSQIARNDYARAWQTLHPQHQGVAPRAEYVACEESSPIPGRLDRIRALRVRRHLFRIPGGTTAERSAAVTFRLRISDRALGVSTTMTHTVHAVSVDGRWRWILPAARYELYRADDCGGIGAPESTETPGYTDPLAGL